MNSLRDVFIAASYLVAASLFIIGLKRLSSPATARLGNAVAALGMLIAIVATLLVREIISFQWIVVGLLGGSAVGALMALRVNMTAMPQLVGILNAFGGGASALVAFSEYVLTPGGRAGDVSVTIVLAIIIGAVTFSGSVVAAGKLQEVIPGRAITYPLQKSLNAFLLLLALGLSVYVAVGPYDLSTLLLLTLVALLVGVLGVLPIGGADMPVVISLMNSYSGIAGSMAGFVLHNNALIISGALVGASGMILTRIMCQAMNRSLANVMFGAFGSQAIASQLSADGKSVREASTQDVAIMLAYARKVVIVPGYGMAVSQAQHQVRELADLLEERGVEVMFGIHPVAGRMPGHMNVLLAEANVPYPALREMEQVNPEMERTDVAMVIGANDVVNPAARDQPGSPIYGMPIINVDKAKTVIVLKRSMNTGFAGIDNDLFYRDNTRMLFGDARKTLTDLIGEVSAV
ncbi:MAG TPA: NAD(P)(+) transhydrogenase (Re/Si-specific) subunit beta [Longimicrobiales bacterium]|nr:NAD(P)(+) transhydrogenase (Re/Si-specific) subunit beta [Longimicrobiales bacterium]